MRKLKYLIAGTFLLFSSISSAAVIDGRDWRQVTDTTNLSWNQVNSICSGGACSGSIGSVSFDGWTWASANDVAGLFSTYNSAFTSPSTTFDQEISSPWAPAFFNDFDPTSSTSTPATTTTFGIPPNTITFTIPASNTNLIRGLTSTIGSFPFPFGGTITFPRVAEVVDIAGGFIPIDRMSTVSMGDFGSANNITGHWLYRSADVIALPEPGTLLLFGIGLAGLAYTQRRRTI